MKEENDFISIERDDEYFAGEDDSEASIYSEPNFLGVCWGIQVFEVCIESANTNEVVFVLKFQGRTVGRYRLNGAKPCLNFKIKELGVVLKLNICANFTKRQVVAKGHIKALGAKIPFKQVILTF